MFRQTLSLAICSWKTWGPRQGTTAWQPVSSWYRRWLIWFQGKNIYSKKWLFNHPNVCVLTVFRFMYINQFFEWSKDERNAKLGSTTRYHNSTLQSGRNPTRNCGLNLPTNMTTWPWGGVGKHLHNPHYIHMNVGFTQCQKKTCLLVAYYWVYHGPLEMKWDDVPSVYPLRTSSYCELHSGKHTKNYWTWPFIVDLPTIKQGDFL